MRDFINIDDSVTVDFEEYLTSLNDPGLSLAIKHAWQPVLPVLNLMKLDFGTQVDVPHIFIKTSDRVFAEGSVLGIIVSAGLIKHCVNASWPQAYEVLGATGPAIVGGNMVAQLGLTWVLAHEYAHAFRAHSKVLEAVGHTASACRATEHDADLCATAAIYRSLQRMFGRTMADIDVRRFAMYAIYWSIRSLPEQVGDTHSPLSERLVQILMKLVGLTVTPDEAVDVNCERPETQARIQPLISAMVACEQFYEIDRGPSGYGFLRAWHNYVSSDRHVQCVEDWMHIAPLVQQLAGC